MREAFIDDGQWFLLLQDAKEFSEGSGFEQILTEFITQLKPTNVFPTSFDYKLNLEEYKTKLPKIVEAEDFFQAIKIDECDLKIKELDEFKSYFACGICS